MAIEVFNRYEKKYLLDEETYQRVLEAIKDYMIPDKYNQKGEFYKICNIYYDTRNDDLIRASIEKPIYKEKLRVRSYNTPGLEDKVFIEIKKKYNKVVNKRRTNMKLIDAYKYLEDGTYPKDLTGVNVQVLRELDYFKEVYKLLPKVYLSYDRLAFFEKDNGDLRITFDKNITARREDVRLELGSFGQELLEDRNYLMEVKTSGAVPIWFVKIISEFNIYPRSFSKYGTEYKNKILS